MRFNTFVLIPLLAVSACGYQSTQPPSSTAGLANALPASKEPEAANSLPKGAQTDAPLTSSVGDINSVQVGPATRSTARINAVTR